MSPAVKIGFFVFSLDKGGPVGYTCNMSKKYPRTNDRTTCTKCKEEKEATEFYSKPEKRNGLRSACIACEKIRDKGRRKHPCSENPQECVQCGEVKAAAEFALCPGNKSGLRGECMACGRIARRRRLYGITPETHLRMLDAQNYECICGKPITVSDDLDHCHTTGRLRNILCAACNRLIGHANDDPNLLEKHAENLRQHQQLEAQGVSQWGYVPDSK
jgi:hypothetical protein